MSLIGRVASCERALSLTQPWAWLIVSMPGGLWKNVENRKEGFSHKSFRGDFFVHAAKGCTRAEYVWCLDWVRRAFGEVVGEQICAKIPAYGEIVRGGIVGLSHVTHVLSPETADVGYGDEGDEIIVRQWHMLDQYGFVLRDRAELPFVPCTGHLGFWRVPPLVRAELLGKMRGLECVGA